MQKIIIIFSFLLLSSHLSAQQNATIKEYDREFKTYPYSDPDPIPKFELIYPYYRFDGYTDDPINKNWKVVELENEFIKVMILPEIGGKIWTAIEKSTGKPFIYFNQVVKFRDIAMRGAWTSGGIEANYGIMGHTPNCSTPVDYKMEKKADGSVSCYIGTLDLLTQTYWTIEINLPRDKAYFTTRSFWHNSTSLEQPYYTWMNAGIKAEGDLQFIYPGNKYIEHDGDYGEWPINKENGKDVSFYKNNNFGQYKSYHVFGKRTNFFGGYWHDEDFGMGRYATYADKPGKKIWIWGLSEQGMIWDKLLTDTDGQYVEVQSGKLYNQTAAISTFTPFKHRGFAPYTTDEWIEYWFPVKGTKGFVQANPFGALNAYAKDGKLNLAFSPLQSFKEKIEVEKDGEVLFSKEVNFEVLKPYEDSFAFSGDTKGVVVRVGDKVVYDFNPEQGTLSRPVDSPEDFDWVSAYGHWLQGKEFIRARNYKQAEISLKASLEKDPNYLPALADMAMLMNINGLYEEAFNYSHHGLRIDTYDPAANYYYGLSCKYLGKIEDAKDGFDIAMQSLAYRGAAATELSKIYFKEKDYLKAAFYATKAIDNGKGNITAYQILELAQRKSGDSEKAKHSLEVMESQDPLNHFARFEKFMLDESESNKNDFTSMIRNEMPWESYLQLGIEYYELGLLEECIEVLNLSPFHPEVNYWIAFAKKENGEKDFESLLKDANNYSPKLVLPFRTASKEVLRWAITVTDHWKSKYYLGLVYWHAQQMDEAKRLFLACANTPDFAPFYAARANLIAGNQLTDLKKAASMNVNEWRYGKLLVNYYLENGNTLEAVNTARQYNIRLPKNYLISMLLAKALLFDGQFEASGKILANTKILPYEGATESRLLYREAWLMQAAGDMGKGKYKNALAKIKTARMWPVNLGVGKPYDENIDDRLENYMESLCFEGMKNEEEAKMKWNEIIQMDATNDFGNFIAAETFKKAGRLKEGTELMTSWVETDPGNELANWSRSAFNGDINHDFSIDNSDFRIMKAVLNSSKK